MLVQPDPPAVAGCTSLPWFLVPEASNLDEEGQPMTAPHRGTFIASVPASAPVASRTYGNCYAVAERIHNPDDAYLIVRAVNAYQPLLALMHRLADLRLQGQTGPSGHECRRDPAEAIALLDSLARQARGLRDQLEAQHPLGVVASTGAPAALAA